MPQTKPTLPAGERTHGTTVSESPTIHTVKGKSGQIFRLKLSRGTIVLAYNHPDMPEGAAYTFPASLYCTEDAAKMPFWHWLNSFPTASEAVKKVAKQLLSAHFTNPN